MSGRAIKFEFSADAIARMDRLKEKTEAVSYAELVRNGLRVYEWMIEQTQAGYEVGLVKGGVLEKVVKVWL